MVKQFFPYKHPINRDQKRAAMAEIKTCHKKLDSIENEFIRRLFDASCWGTYEALYQIAFTEYKYMVEWLIRNKRLNYIQINKEYFTEVYKPIEKL